MKTILVVEDDPTLRGALRETLRERGYKVAVAENGKSALSRLQEGLRPCLILLDLMMPEVDGWDFLGQQRIDRSLAAIPVIVLSSYLVGSERDSVLPAAGFLKKPIDPEALLEQIERHCGTVTDASE
jgi:CheY-like chemotaxis protein